MSKKNIVALILSLFFIINIIAIFVPMIAKAETNIKIKYNNQELTSDVAPFISNNRVLIPVRMVFEALGAAVYWNEQYRFVTITYGEKNFQFTIDSNIAYVNSSEYILDTEAKVYSGRTFVPVRFLAENCGLNVTWSDMDKTVYINSEENSVNYLNDIVASESLVKVSFGNSSIKYNKFILENPLRLVIDIDNCIKATEKTVEVSGRFFNGIRYAQYSSDPKVCRVVVDLSGNNEYEISVSDTDLYINFDKSQKPGNNTNTNNANTNNKRKVVVIDAGHGGKDPGALGKDGDTILLREKDVNLKIALKVYEKLKQENIDVYITRTTDKYLTLSQIVEFANSKNADLFVSVHNNAAESSSVSGTMVMYAYDEDKEGYNISGKEVAEIIQKHLVVATEGYDFGARKNSSLYVVKNTKMPAVITESLFVTNETDREKLMNDAVVERIADAIYKGICEVLGL